MIVERTLAFDEWLKALRAGVDRAIIAKRIARIERTEHLGDVEPVGSGVSELRIHIGPGYRIYLMQRGQALILLLCGGDKSSQTRDIAKAKELAAVHK